MSSSRKSPRAKMSEDARLLEIQRRAFEEQFGSLESMGFKDSTKTTSDNESEDDSESNSGSDAESEAEIEAEIEAESEIESESESESEQEAPQRTQPRVIKFQGPSDDYVPLSKKEQKLLRSGRSLGKARQPASQEARQDPPSDDEDNLKNDIELDRFLKESHLLSALGAGNIDTNDASDSSIVGKARARTLEMRLRGLSTAHATDSALNKLEKMPMQVRKGMVNKHLKRIGKHEHEAREGGVVLSNVKRGEFRRIDSTFKSDIERRIGTGFKKKAAMASKRRQRGLKVQSVGRSTRNGLVLSQAEIARIGGSKRRK